MYRVSKVLNNNGVIAIDMDENKEYVILGKGVGFGKKVSQRFDKPEGCTTYRLEQETERGSAKELVKGIEPDGVSGDCRCNSDRVTESVWRFHRQRDSFSTC